MILFCHVFSNIAEFDIRLDDELGISYEDGDLFLYLRSE